MVIVSLDNLHRAREAVRKAKHALKSAEREYDEDCRYGEGNLSLIAKIRAAERRLQQAREDLLKIDPTLSGTQLR